MTYIADEGYFDAALKPYDWYLDLAVKGAEEHGLPSDYVIALSARPWIPDTVPDRATMVQAYSVLAPIKQEGIALCSHANIRIAGDRRIGHWVAARAKLIGASDPDAWRQAHSDFFMERLNARYFKPIQAIDAMRSSKGEGFAIVAIQCSLIEFLGSTLEGKSYKYQRGKKKPQEYDDSRALFVKFLTTAEPFKNSFSEPDATDFYKNVRCGLLHEARTKNGWTILSKKAPGACIDAVAKTIYRRDLQNAFLAFCKWYREALSNEKPLQEAFIRKFNSLCAD